MQLLPTDFLQKSVSLPVFDVRSPAEYAHAHIPQAHNLPLFENEERAAVGTCYKIHGQDAAVRLGLQIVGPKLASFVHQADTLAPQREVLMYCWRGGMRSGSMAWLLRTAGFKVCTLAGGYKAYRTHLLAAFDQPHTIVILGGKTGSGKTDILRQLAANGEQVIDLEALAHHKGSSYGGIGQAPQPSTEQFENLLYQQWAALDPSRRVWIEDESRKIGTCLLPGGLWQQMQTAKLIHLQLPKSVRIARLVREYACLPEAELLAATTRLQKRLGGQHYQAAVKALAQKDYATVADITLTYYDKAYLHGLAQRPPENLFTLEVEEDNPKKIARKLMENIF
jgi:tRNA 2-selenouridine synthase